MYTQCPDCSVAFRVTADVLKQAAGKVRCGGCGSAFNALEYLSEEMPEKTPAKEAGAALPELKPEPAENDAGLPAAISAEQSAALLKTLDELAGSDIRIEDTGVEWRVLEDDEVGDAADDELAFDIRVEDQPEIDELLEDSPTPVDQFLTETPPQVEAPEIFADDANSADSVRIDELRFDDNTPLPDDFDLDDEASYLPLPDPEPAAEKPDVVVEENPQADLDLSEPDEWTDILDEFEELAEAVSTPSTEPTIADELAAMGTLEDDEAQEEAPPDDTVIDAPDISDDEPLDMDSQFALQAEAMGIDLSGMHQSIEAEEESQEEEDLDALLDDSRIVDRDIDDLLEEELVDDATVGDLEFEDFEAEEDEEDEDDLYLDDDDGDRDDDEPVADDTDDELPAEPDEDDFEIDELGLEVDLAAAELAEDEDEDEDELVIPPLTEEEQTINMMIDQDLLAIAIEDEDGFASTIVLPDGSAEDKAQEEKSAKASKGVDDDEAEEKFRDTSSGFETIIMEGESIQTALDEDRLAANAAAAASLADAAAAERAKENAARGGNRRYGMVAGVVVLALLLVGQYLHQSREMLATIPAFNNVVGPMYRALGQPLSPEWDITGWRFEATKGSTDENDEQLTIYSRIGNKSDTPLPYPLIGISLTDRFEETVGSRILDPAEYLSNDLDPRKLVQPGNTFNAVITIQSPSEEATGFKLNVCYRESGGNLRCALDDFK